MWLSSSLLLKLVSVVGKTSGVGLRYLGNREIEGAGKILCEPFVPGHEEGKYYSK